MNDRLTELYAKACLDARDIHPADVPAFIACMAGNLAELIIRECIQVSGPEDSYTDEWFKSKVDSVQKIKKHFGVEE